MRTSNFVAFLTVQGFFVGFVFAILKAQSAESVLVYTLLITVFFYLFAHFIISFFIRHTPIKQEYFPKMRHETDLDYYVKEILKREKVIDNNSDFLEALDRKYMKKKSPKGKAA